LNDVPQQNRRPTPMRRLLLATGSAALLLAMASDALAVLGRHIGFAVNGSIELFQVCAVVALSSAILIATLDGRHAAVDLLLLRVPDCGKAWLRVLARAAGAVAFGLITIGSIWVAIDLWPTHEMTEQLGIPLRGFRLFWIACSGTVTLFFLRMAIRGNRA
jgi:TRAP-type C4-dicarboxylate transport system permease small subunit